MFVYRELSINAGVEKLRRRLTGIIIPALVALFAGFLISYAFPAKYTSQSLVLVEEQKVPQGYVKSVVTEDLTQRIATLQQQVLSRNRLQPMIDRLGLAKGGKNLDDVIDDIRQNVAIEPVETELSVASSTKKRPGQSNVPGFYVN